jgi:hypothetical protein
MFQLRMARDAFLQESSSAVSSTEAGAASAEPRKRRELRMAFMLT